MGLKATGQMVAAAGQALPAHLAGVGLGAFIVMPNHFHGFVVVGVGATLVVATLHLDTPPDLAERARTSRRARGVVGVVVSMVVRASGGEARRLGGARPRAVRG